MQITHQKGIRCKAAARYVVEGYSPKDGRLHGSLDAEVYACAEHLQDARTKWLGELASYVPQWNPKGRPYPCGRRTEFTDQAQLDVFAAAEEAAAEAEPEKCPDCGGRGARVLPSACAETECGPCEGTGWKGAKMP